MKHVPELAKAEKDNLPTPGKHSTGQIEYPAQVHKPPRYVNMLTIIIRKNYYQTPEGEFKFFNYHRYGEIFVLPKENVPEATLTRKNGPKDEFFDYLDYRSHFFEGGYFPSMETIKEQYPGSEFTFNMKYADGREMSHTMNLPEAEIPPPVSFTLYQDGEEIDPTLIDPDKELTVKWSDFGGKLDPNGIMDDPVLLRFDACEEPRKLIYISGVPTLNGQYLTYKDEKWVVPAETLRPGEWFWLKGEWSRNVETSIFDGAPAISSYMTATYFATRTIGGTEECPCLETFVKLKERDRFWME